MHVRCERRLSNSVCSVFSCCAALAPRCVVLLLACKCSVAVRERTSSARVGRGWSSPLAAIFCFRLLLLAARAGLSALDSALTSLEAERLAVGVLPRDVRELAAMASALVGGVGEARA